MTRNKAANAALYIQKDYQEINQSTWWTSSTLGLSHVKYNHAKSIKGQQLWVTKNKQDELLNHGVFG